MHFLVSGLKIYSSNNEGYRVYVPKPTSNSKL